MEWYRIDVPEGAGTRLILDFGGVCVQAGTPKRMAMFDGGDEKDLLSWAKVYFIDPESAQHLAGFLERWNAVRCDDPGLGDLSARPTAAGRWE